METHVCYSLKQKLRMNVIFVVFFLSTNTEWEFKKRAEIVEIRIRLFHTALITNEKNFIFHEILELNVSRVSGVSE